MVRENVNARKNTLVQDRLGFENVTARKMTQIQDGIGYGKCHCKKDDTGPRRTWLGKMSLLLYNNDFVVKIWKKKISHARQSNTV